MPSQKSSAAKGAPSPSRKRTSSLHRLKEPYREVFTLRVLGELHFRDIADLFGKSESWAKVTFYRAKDKLIEDMEEHHEH